MSEPLPLLIDDPELQAEIIRAAHGLLVAMVNHESDQLVESLLRELIAMHPAALVPALGEAHATLRVVLDVAETQLPGFRQGMLRAIGAALAE